MIPNREPSGAGPGKKAERCVWLGLKEGLSDEYFVYPGLKFFQGSSGLEGEADFLVLHREHGLLVIEVKGHGVHRNREGIWFREGRNGAVRMKRGPFEQAEETMRELVKIFTERIGGPLKQWHGKLPLTYGWCVVFPFADRGEALLPINVETQLLLDSRGIDQIGDWVRKTMEYWKKTSPVSEAPTARDFKTFRKDVVMPVLQIVESVGAQIRVDERQYVQLDHRQSEILSSLLVNRRLLVEGAAGTGKTVLALAAARQLAQKHDQMVLLTCFNKYLARSLQQQVEAWDLQTGEVRVHHFHQLCYLAFQKLGREMVAPLDMEERLQFWRVEAPEVLFEAVSAGAIPRVNALVIDEAQDFEDEWFVILEGLLQEPQSAHLVVFHDPRQNLFGRVGAPSFDQMTHWPLSWVFRNTKRICETINTVDGVQIEPHPDVPDGERTQIIQVPVNQTPIQHLERIVKDLVTKQGVLPEQIVVLTPHSKKNSSLAHTSEIAGVSIKSDPMDRGNAIVHATIPSYKGMDADVVLLVDIDASDPRCSAAHQYVGMSRAKHRLFVLRTT